MASEWIEFTGHPTPLRSRATTAIQQDSLHTLPEDQLRYLLERALESAHFPHGHDMVALTRGDQQIVMSWGEWNWLMAVLLGCKYETESSTHGPSVSEGDAHVLRSMIKELHKHGQKGAALLPYDLPSGFVEFLEGGAFQLIDIG